MCAADDSRQAEAAASLLCHCRLSEQEGQLVRRGRQIAHGVAGVAQPELGLEALIPEGRRGVCVCVWGKRAQQVGVMGTDWRAPAAGSGVCGAFRSAADGWEHGLCRLSQLPAVCRPPGCAQSRWPGAAARLGTRSRRLTPGAITVDPYNRAYPG